MADELTRTQQWINQQCVGDSILRGIVGASVWAENAPQGTPYPLVVFGLIIPHDVVTATGHERIMVESLWRIYGVTEGPTFDDTLQTIADRLDAIFDRSAGGTADQAVIFTSVREEPYLGSVVDEGKDYRRLGGLFRVWTQLQPA